MNKPCNNYQMKKSCIIEMLNDEGRDLDQAYIEALIHDTSLFPVSEGQNLDWGLAIYEKNGKTWMLDFKNNH